MAFIGKFVMYVVSMIVRGFVFAQMWAWFVVPTFNAPTLKIPAALGISNIVSYLTAHLKQSDAFEKQSYGTQIVISICITLMFLLIGFVLHLFM